MTSADRIQLPAGARVIRRLTPPDAPWPCALVSTDQRAKLMLVDAELLADWDGWDASSDGHVLAPLDVLRRADGHDVLLPLCTERAETFLARRGADLALTGGETVTLAVSVLRGMSEIARRDRVATVGSWWLTDDGRPVFVDQCDGTAASEVTAGLLDRLAEDAAGPLGDELAAAAAGVREEHIRAREIDQMAERLFDLVAAEPLATSPLASARRRSIHPVAVAGEIDDAKRPWMTTMLAAVDTDLADAFSRATTGLWRRLRRPARSRRRRPWALAGCLGAGVIAVGLLWPAPGGPAIAEPNATPSAPTTPGGISSAAPSADPEPAAPEPSASSAPSTQSGAASTDLVSIAGALLEARRDCLAGGDDSCLADVMEEPSRVVPGGTVDVAGNELTLTLLDDFGGVAVLRADNATGATASQLIVITDSAGRWLLRDVHDIAQQP